MSELTNAIKQICEEKGLSFEAVISTIESALAAAYRKDYGKKNQNIVVEFDPDTAKSKVFDVKEVVEDQPEEEEEEKEAEVISLSAKATEDKSEKSEEEKKEEKKEASDVGEEKKDGESTESAEEEEEVFKFNPKTMIELSDAKLIKKTAKVGDELRMKLDPPEDYGRMAAQTAKQVIIQRLREAEREMVFADFKEKEHEVVSGVVQRREGKIVLVDLGKSVGVLTPEEMIPGERYNPGDRVKVFVKEVNSRAKGPEIVLSRTSEEILRKIFYLEIPEVANGLIEIKAVAREAGFRSKVAVWTDSDNVDPIGSCVGQRGARIQTIISELGGEKVDIITYDEDPVAFISNALSPAKILTIDINEEEKKATVRVAEDQLSLAIGKGGQNARLAAKLTGWKVDIVQEDGSKPSAVKKKEVESSSAEATEDKGEKSEKQEEKPGEELKNEKKEEESGIKDQESGDSADAGKEEEEVVEKATEEAKEEATEEMKESADTDEEEK